MSHDKVRILFPSDMTPRKFKSDPDQRCAWAECQQNRMGIIPVCDIHAYRIYREMDARLQPQEPKAEKSKHFLVYYLMIAPTTVKIGTTKDLLARLKHLRSDLQYVVAVEPGSFKLETERHHQFVADRIGRKEDFRVSAEIEDHIRHLRESTYSDEILAMYQDLAPGRDKRMGFAPGNMAS